MAPFLRTQATRADESLCSNCLQNIVPAIPSGLVRLAPYGVSLTDVGAFYMTGGNVSCPLCRMLSQSYLPGEDSAQARSSSRRQRPELWAFPYLHYSKLVDNNRLEASDLIGQNESSFLMLLADRKLSDHKISSHIRSKGCAVLRRKKRGSGPILFSAQTLPANFDASVVMSWLDYCHQNHTDLCRRPASSPVIPGFHLIDCETSMVEPVDDDRAYIAFSYVWGDSAGEDSLRTVDGARTLPPKVPLAISDAMTVTKMLGHRYLWIDKYCIDQEDATTKHEQIQHMDTIYERAALTIIAAAGQDASHGLPGVSRRPRNVQPSVHLHDYEVLWTMPDPHHVVRRTKWFSRGWTFQEAVLSRRCLVFLDDQVYFECKSMNCSESIASSLDLIHTDTRQELSLALRRGVFGRNKRREFGRLDSYRGSLDQCFIQYLSAVEEYSGRDLRFHTDSLNAFKGFMKRFSRRKEAINDFWGLPCPGHTSEAERMSYMVYSLSWTHVTRSWLPPRPKRRTEFPSWAWAGWAGKVQYHGFIRCDAESEPSSPGGQARPTGDIRDGRSTTRILYLSMLSRSKSSSTESTKDKSTLDTLDTLDVPSERSRSRTRRSRAHSLFTRRDSSTSTNDAGPRLDITQRISNLHAMVLNDAKVPSLRIESQGHVFFPGPFWNMVRSIMVEDQSGHTIDLGTLYSFLSDRTAPIPRILVLEAQVVPPELIVFNKLQNTQWSWQVCDISTSLFLSQGPESEIVFAEQIESGQAWRFILLGWADWGTEQERGGAIVMILRRLPGCADLWSRAGCFVVHCLHFHIRDITEALGGSDAGWESHRIV